MATSANSAAGSGREWEVLDAVREAMADLVQSTARARMRLDQYQDLSPRMMQLDQMIGRIAELDDELYRQGKDFVEACHVISERRPVTDTYGNGGVWKGPQRPGNIVSLAIKAERMAATSGAAELPGITYLEALADPRHQDQPMHCSRHKTNGQECGQYTVRLPGRARTAACWSHLTPAEQEQVNKVKEEVKQGVLCTECGAQTGDSCVDSTWSKPNFHMARFDRYAARFRPGGPGADTRMPRPSTTET